MILLLAADTPDRQDLAAFLTDSDQRFTAMDAHTVESAKVPKANVEAIVVDLASSDAIKFLKKYAGQEHRVPVVCIADRRRASASADALRLGAIDIITRPLRGADVMAAIDNAREFGAIEQRNAPAGAAEATADGVFGASPAMRDVLALVRRVAASRCTVTIVGERGTGREMVARVIHTHGARHDRPFVKIACGAARPADLVPMVESNGAGGETVYLEDFSELPMPQQIKLEDLLMRMHANPDAPRYIAGAEPRLAESIERGEIRRGLADALSLVRIDLPPLRQRPQDIPVLALHFLKDGCTRNGIPAKSFSSGALALLSSLPWRGNASELRAVCERLAVVIPRGVVLLEDVLASVRFDGAETIGRPKESLRDAREQFERDYVTAALQHHHGRMGAAARELGIERTNLYRKLKQLNIRWAGLTD